MQNAGLDEAQAGIKIDMRNTNNLRYADDTTLMAKSEDELETLDKNERGEWKIWLKTQHSKNEDWHLVPSLHGQIDGETVETVTDFIFWTLKSLQMVTVAMKLKDTCSLEEKLWPT